MPENTFYYIGLFFIVILALLCFYVISEALKKELDKKAAKYDMDEYSKSQTIHGMFGLTYANYLVLPRTLLQSMPGDWQVKFKDLMDEYSDKLDPWIDPDLEYQVNAKDYLTKKFVKDPLSNYQRGRRHVINDNEPRYKNK